ncbi:MAG: hypothetical protein R2882_02260 [Gemmatimonadales bacterium]
MPGEFVDRGLHQPAPEARGPHQAAPVFRRWRRAEPVGAAAEGRGVPERERRGQRVDADQLAPELDRLGVVGRVRVPGGTFDRLSRQTFEAGPLGRGPFVELGGIRQDEPVEQRRVVLRGHRRPIPLRVRGQELADVGLRAVLHQAQAVAGGLHDLLAEILVDAVDGLRKVVAGAFFGRIRPEIKEETVAAHPTPAGGRQDRQKGGPAGSQALHPGPAAFHAQAPESLDLNHVRPG